MDRLIFFFFILITLLLSDCAQYQLENEDHDKNSIQDNEFTQKFIKYYDYLDATISGNLMDRSDSTFEAIEFFETHTEIKAEGDMCYFGKILVSKEDLKKWRAWYNSEFLRGNK